MVESAKNSLTELMRERLNHLTLDFTSINAHGKIMYLGTPQSTNSIYNNLTARGYDIRIWTGRVPNEEEREHYGDMLADRIQKMYDTPSNRTGYGALLDRGKPTDPIMMDEYQLVKKEIDQGKGYFNLQYMLNTALLDKDRFPLKVKDLIVHDLDKNKVPTILQWSNHPMHQITNIPGQIPQQVYYRAGVIGDDYGDYVEKVMAIDPAGGAGGGDETGYAIVYSGFGKIFIMAVGTLPGGTDTQAMQRACELLNLWDIQKCVVEKNFGYGAFAVALESAVLEWNFKLKGKPELEKQQKTIKAGVIEVYNTGQKELRIIDTIEPALSNHKIVMCTSVITDNIQSTQKYEAANRVSYNLMHQMGNLTRDKGSLLKDDRIDALSIAIKEVLLSIRMVDEQEAQRNKDKQLSEMQQDKHSPWNFMHKMGKAGGTGILDKLNRRR